MHRTLPTSTNRHDHAFTLIELVAVMVVLAILSAVAIPKYFDYADRAREAADVASINGIEVALGSAHMQHQLISAPSNQWITTVSMITPLMETNELPLGITISGSRLKDQRGNEYVLTPETADNPAYLIIVTVVNPGGGGS